MVQENSGGAAAKAPTIYDVAALAGVSHQTVSRFLKDRTALKPSTLEKVESALAQLDYTPNLAARSLRSKARYRIVVVVPEASLYFPARMLNGAAGVAQEAGYRVDVVTTDNSTESRQARLRSLLLAEDIAGVLSFVPDSGGTEETSVPLVVAGEYDDQMRARGTLADGSAAAKVIEHLASLGHRKFFHVAGPAAWPSARNRKAAYLDAIAAQGLDSLGVEDGDWSAASGYAAGSKIASTRGVTAVFAGNDHMAIGVIRALHEHGLTVPGDVSVCGWDDMAESAFLVPSLTTIHMDLEGIGAGCMRELIHRIRGEAGPVQPPRLEPMELVIRESTGPVSL